MKKLHLFAAIVILFSSILTSCKPSGPHCQAYSKADKVKADKTERSL